MSSHALKVLRDELDWANVEKRFQFLGEFIALIEDWQCELPDLLDIFQRAEIEQLLLDSVIYKYQNPIERRGQAERFVAFVSRTGYANVPEVDENGEPLLHRTTPLHLLAGRCISSVDQNSLDPLLSELWSIYNRYDANYVDADGLTHLHVACQYGDKDIVKRFLDAGLDPNCIWTKTGDTPLHLILDWYKMETIELLLSRGADPGLANAKGDTCLHGLSEAICGADDLAEVVCRDEAMPVDARNNAGRTALHLAVGNNKTRLGDFLLRRGADPNAVDREGRTPLHAMCKNSGRFETMAMFFRVNDDMQREVLIDVQDNSGDTPLHVALAHNYEDAVKLLLKRGADPNVANAKGLTALHIICQGKPITIEGTTKVIPYKGETFFKLIHDNSLHAVRTINARDELGNTPLHYAVKSGNKKLIQLLLRRGGADPNATNAEGLAPVEIIYGNHSDDGMVDLLFKIGYELKRPLRVRVDARYDATRTLLQWAVASLRPRLVDVYWRSTTNPAGFVFPSAEDFYELYVNSHELQEQMSPEVERCARRRKEFEHKQNEYRLGVILDAVSVIRRLQIQGYQLKRPDALTIMKVFDKLGFAFGDTKESFNEEKFTDSSRSIMIIPRKSVSMYDLMHLPLERTVKVFTFGQFKVAIQRRGALKALADDDARDAARRKMISTLLRQFTRAWAAYSFPELMRRLPNLCCDMIFEHLSSKDFWSITAAAELPASRDDARRRRL
ncbi:hypothetical protein TKK_0007679 [Trichogramma kaykai]|uniref:PRANC domain-containing protein n=2 Tax=Trichogramma kaykai TaxID=54128 RepID=A0ABD2X7R4_9HYME